MATLRHMDDVRLQTVGLNGKRKVRTVKADLVYFPSVELNLEAESKQWHLGLLGAAASGCSSCHTEAEA